MQVLFLFERFDSVMISTISAQSLATWIPLPQLVFSPGLMIQMFLIVGGSFSASFLSVGGSSISLPCLTGVTSGDSSSYNDCYRWCFNFNLKAFLCFMSSSSLSYIYLNFTNSGSFNPFLMWKVTGKLSKTFSPLAS